MVSVPFFLIGERVIIESMAQSFRNPKIYVTTPEPTPWDRLQRRKRLATGIFVAIFTVGLFWLLFFSPVFAVTELLVEGPATQDMRGRFEEFRGKNIFLLNSDRLEQELKAQYPHIKSLAIFRGLPNALKIELLTREEAMLWETGGTRYLIDFEGVPFADVTNNLEQTLAPSLQGIVEQPATSAVAGLPLVVDTRNAPVVIGSPLVSPEFVVFAQTVTKDFQPTTGLGITALRVGETTFQIEVVTTEGFTVFLDTTRKPTPQLTALKKILETNRDKVKEYVDLRVAGKAYLK